MKGWKSPRKIMFIPVTRHRYFWVKSIYIYILYIYIYIYMVHIYIYNYIWLYMQKHHWIISKKQMYMLFFLRPSLSTYVDCVLTPGILPAALRFSYLSTQPTETVELDPMDTSGVFQFVVSVCVGVISGMWPGVNPSCHQLYMIYIYIYVYDIYIYICIWCIYIYMYIYIYIYVYDIYIYIYICIWCIYMYIYMSMYIYIYIYLYMIYIYIYVYAVYIYICIYICICIYIYVYDVYIYMCIYIYISIWCIYICVYIYIWYIYMYMMYIYICIYIYVYVYIYMMMYIYICIYIYMYICIWCIYICIYIYMYIYMYMMCIYICVYDVYMYIYIYVHLWICSFHQRLEIPRGRCFRLENSTILSLAMWTLGQALRAERPKVGAVRWSRFMGVLVGSYRHGGLRFCVSWYSAFLSQTLIDSTIVCSKDFYDLRDCLG